MPAPWSQRYSCWFVPQFGGFCAYGAAGGYKAKIEPEAFSIIDGKLYLNYNAKVQSEWSKDTSGYIAKAEKQWPAMSTQTKVIP
ncbi:MAG: YHS domain-containing (seleno)protein [Betaproteobacteria bacterium]